VSEAQNLSAHAPGGSKYCDCHRTMSTDTSTEDMENTKLELEIEIEIERLGQRLQAAMVAQLPERIHLGALDPSLGTLAEYHANWQRYNELRLVLNKHRLGGVAKGSGARN